MNAPPGREERSDALAALCKAMDPADQAWLLNYVCGYSPEAVEAGIELRGRLDAIIRAEAADRAAAPADVLATCPGCGQEDGCRCADVLSEDEPPQCTSTAGEGHYRCELTAGHQGLHHDYRDGDDNRWGDPADPEHRALLPVAGALPECVCGDPATAHRNDHDLHRAPCTRRGCTCPDYEVPAGRELEVLPGGAA